MSSSKERVLRDMIAIGIAGLAAIAFASILSRLILE